MTATSHSRKQAGKIRTMVELSVEAYVLLLQQIAAETAVTEHRVSLSEVVDALIRRALGSSSPSVKDPKKPVPTPKTRSVVTNSDLPTPAP
jgi:hypothetical protein